MRRVDLPGAVEGIEQALSGEVGDLPAKHGLLGLGRAQVGDPDRLKFPCRRKGASPEPSRPPICQKPLFWRKRFAQTLEMDMRSSPFAAQINLLGSGGRGE